MTLNGIDVMVRDGWAPLKGKRIALVCNQASIAKDGRHLLDLAMRASETLGFEVVCAMGPQHGIWGHTQDNMIEWEGYVDPRTGLRFYSLYGETREPMDHWLEGVDEIVIDIVDVGSRFYTFIWSLANCMKVCERLGIRLRVLDRVNPISGTRIEGTVNDPNFLSFVGLHPLPMRHGMTAGEIARHVRATVYPNADLAVTEVEGWDRNAYFDETDLMWAQPSPNMPTVDTAVVYPGACLIEGTQLSEGRGTTRPFEWVGAPYVDGWALAKALNAEGLGGVTFRPVPYQPTFQKFKDEYCGGVFVHVTDRDAFEPVLTYVALIREIMKRWPTDFKWLDPPYEYELVKMPFDILAGNQWLRASIESYEPLERIRERMRNESVAFNRQG